MTDFPSADQVATAIVTAARLVGERPIECACGVQAMRCRPIAAEALIHVFPKARKAGVFRCVGWPTEHSSYVKLRSAKQSKWWDDDFVDEVVGALIPEELEREEA